MPLRPNHRRTLAAGLLAGTAGVGAGCAVRQVSEQAPISLAAVPVQYGKGALEPVAFVIAEADWRRVESLFCDPPPATAADERDRISAAIGVLERIAGEHTRAGEDLARNKSPHGSVGQMDCIDESTNTDTYLRLLAQQGLLRHHEVDPPVRRYRWLISVHRTAVIRETATGDLYAVDSWFYDSGAPAVVLPLEVWRTGEADPPHGRPRPGGTGESGVSGLTPPASAPPSRT